MKKLLQQQLNKLYINLVWIFAIPNTSFAAGTQYKPLVDGGIPGLRNGATIAEYVNALFKIALMLGVVLSVLIIAYAGFEYMTFDQVTKKGMAKIRIRQAITGLLMLLSTYLVLYQINPDIVKINF